MEIYSLDAEEVGEFLDDMSEYDRSGTQEYYIDAFQALQEEAEEPATLEVAGPLDYSLTVQREEGEAVIEGELPSDYELGFQLDTVKNRGEPV